MANPVLTLVFDLALVGTMLWLGSRVMLDAWRPRRHSVGTMRRAATRRAMPATTAARGANVRVVRA